MSGVAVGSTVAVGDGMSAGTNVLNSGAPSRTSRTSEMATSHDTRYA